MLAGTTVALALAVFGVSVTPTHQPVADAVASSERILWMHIPKTGGTSLALVAMKAATNKKGKIGVS